MLAPLRSTSFSLYAYPSRPIYPTNRLDDDSGLLHQIVRLFQLLDCLPLEATHLIHIAGAKIWNSLPADVYFIAIFVYL